MCGISGAIARLPQSALANIVGAMNASIRHRGPDGEGFLEARTAAGYNVALGHRRLSIIDLQTGDQPIGNEDGSVQIVFNGEIYNFQELRDDLAARGHVFRTTSDTEAIVHAYEEYGVACVERLRGMFAFAIWDYRNEQLFLARDRFGQKPLFLHRRANELYFASEIKALLHVPGLQRKVNSAVLADYLTYRYVPGPETLFEGIDKLPPGHTAVWRNGELTVSRYYTAPDAQLPGKPRQSDDLVAEFLHELDEAVRVRMVSDVPFGAFLSGGIDSSAVVALMSRHLDHPVKTFSVGFSESAYSELGYAKVIAEQFKTDHHELEVSQDHLMDELPKLIRHRDAPVSEASDIPIYLLSVEARKSVKMVLTGEGSDEFLGGYPKHVFERYVPAYQAVPGVLRSGLIEPLVHALPYRFRRAKIAIDNLGQGDWARRMAGWFGAIDADEVPDWLRVNGSAFRTAAVPAADASASALRRILYFDQASWLPDNLLERGDRMTMAASLEGRMPFMDHQLAAFISRMPDNYRVRGRKTKWVLREAIARLLPAEIVERPKVGFRVPVNEWFKGPMRGYLEDHLRGAGSVTRVYYDDKLLDRTIEDHVAGRQNNEKVLWSLLNLELWHREFDMSP